MLSVLIAAITSRSWWLVYDALSLQAAGLPVEILYELDSGQATSGVKRQRLVDRAVGEYLCHVDDDDRVAPTYISDILAGCQTGVDVVTFSLAYHGRREEQWTFGFTPDHRDRGLMTANHLCAWRSVLARRVGWCPHLGFADDQMWYKPLYYSGLVKTQYRVPHVLYHYDSNPTTTANNRSDARQRGVAYVGKGLRCFWHNEEIVVEHGHRRHTADSLQICDSRGREGRRPRQELRLFRTVTIV